MASCSVYPTAISQHEIQITHGLAAYLTCSLLRQADEYCNLNIVAVMGDLRIQQGPIAQGLLSRHISHNFTR